MPKNFRLAIFVTFLACTLNLAGRADSLKLPAVFGSHMVLQQGCPVPIWGWAAPGEKVTIRFANQSQTATAGTDGSWRVNLHKMTASGESRTLTVVGADTAHPIELADVLVGEVWVCSGQSNMAFGVSGANDAAREIAAANLPGIRLFTVGNNISALPVNDCSGGWSVCSPATVGGFSAVGFFFGREINAARHVPIGLINTSWGGTIAEAWTSAPALRARLPEFRPVLDAMAGPSTDAAAKFKQQTDDFSAAREKVFAIGDDTVNNVGRAGADFDDSKWKTMILPGNWEGRGLPDLDGVVWFRKTIDIPAAWAGKDLALRPGPIDEVDVTWFNGVQVGAAGNARRHEVQFWNVPRDYRVPGKLVKAGRNVVAIRVIDMMGYGGIYGSPAGEMYVTPSDGSVKTDGSDKARVSLADDWRYEVEFAMPPPPLNANDPNHPSLLFNGMINPLIPFAIRGATWYQGESNVGRGEQYRRLLPALIGDWRSRWGRGDFPFLIVQLANYLARSDAPQESGWAELREAQALTAKNPNVGLAVIIDIGDANDIHPRDKQDVGKRLALAAREIAYREKVEGSGPVFDKLSVVNGQAVVKFKHTTGGLVAKGNKLAGFAIAGADGKFVFCQGRIDGDTVVLSSDNVPTPTTVRYAWADNPEATLYNGAGLPTVPFRSDAPMGTRP